ncbi:MAG: hypothetical protein JO187_11875 [Acidobacteria bacterium]|nr:hypothetical protein [Acidobacteriota bacterium]
MSARNGDKSRFNRQRKQKLRRRVRDQALPATAKKQTTSSRKAPAGRT